MAKLFFYLQLRPLLPRLPTNVPSTRSRPSVGGRLVAGITLHPHYGLQHSRLGVLFTGEGGLRGENYFFLTTHKNTFFTKS